MAKKLSKPTGTAARTSDRSTVSLAEVGKLLGAPDLTVKQWIYRRQLSAVKVANGNWRVGVDDLQRFIEARDRGPKRTVLVAVGPDILTNIRNAVDTSLNEVMCASNAVDGILKTAHTVPSLVVLDTAWPGAWTLAERVRANKTTAHVALLLITDGNLSTDEMDRAVELGAKGSVERTTDLAILRTEISRCLS